MKKRKDVVVVEDFYHDFPSIPIPPSTKSRRLDADLCTIMEEEPDVMLLQQPWTTVHEDPSPSVSPTTNGSEERALVLYEPTNTPLVKSPTSPEFSIVVKADLIPGLKDYLFSWRTAKPDNSVEDEVRREKRFEVSNDCLAVVPWVASHSPMASEEIVPETGQPLEAEEGDMMEMDEPYVNNNNEKAMEIGEMVEAAGASSPWQQHCMMLNLVQNTATPIHWC